MITAVTSLIGTLLYPMFSVIFTFIMAIESMFYGFAGIGDVAVGNQMITSANEGNLTDTGIIYYLLTSEFVRNLFISLLVLAIVLLVLFAAIACVRNMYAEKPKTWQEIFNSTIKGLMGFIITPVLCLVGAWAGNILLKAINEATNPSGTSSLAGELFVVSAYNANIYRMGTDTGSGTAAHVATLTQQGDAYQTLINSNPTIEDYADFVDQCYASKPWTITGQAWVAVGYNVFNINYLLLAVGGVFMLYALGAITFGAVKRMFLLVFYFVLSPLAHSMAPIDDGEAGKKVRGEFYKNFLSVYGAVVGLNLFFSIMPVFQHIDIPVNWAALGGGNATATWASPFHGIFNLIIVIVGLLTVKELISFVSGLAGGGDLYNTGTTTMNSVKGKMKHVKTMGKIGGSFVGGIVKVNSARRNAKRSYLEGLTDDKDNNLDIHSRKDLKGALDSGKITKEQYDQYKSGIWSAKNAAGGQAAWDVFTNQVKQVGQWANKGSGLDIDGKGVVKFFKGQAKEGRELSSNKSKETAYEKKIKDLKAGKEDVFGEAEWVDQTDANGNPIYQRDAYGNYVPDDNGQYKTVKVLGTDANKALQDANKFISKDLPKYNKDENDLKEVQRQVLSSSNITKLAQDVLQYQPAAWKGLDDASKKDAILLGANLSNNLQELLSEKDFQVAKDKLNDLTEYIKSNITRIKDLGLSGFQDKIQEQARSHVNNLSVDNMRSESSSWDSSPGDAANNTPRNVNINADEIANKLGNKLSENESKLVDQLGEKINGMGDKVSKSIENLKTAVLNQAPEKFAKANQNKQNEAKKKNKKKDDE